MGVEHEFGFYDYPVSRLILHTTMKILFGIIGFCLVGKGFAGICDTKKTAVEDLQAAYKRNPVTSAISTRRDNHNLPTDEMIKSVGYPAETYNVTTEDGYILTIHRIPHGKENADITDRPVVFLQHGLLCSSADWIMPTPSKGLGYMLADAGYDVWMGNYRGNSYSRNHVFFNPNKNDGFWDFTWDEMAKYDIPTQIEEVLKLTGRDELQYVGHSMGTTAFMAMHRYRPDVAKKIRLAHLLSPVAYVKHMESPIHWIAGLGPLLDDILSWLGLGEFLPSNLLMDCLASLFCHGFTEGICTNILFLLCGYDQPQMNSTLLDTIMHHTPAGASTSTVLHYAQEVVSGNFQGYDWGSAKENFNHHGAEGIPTYNLADVKTPLAVYYGQNDWLAAAQDVLQTVAELPNIVTDMLVMIEYPSWNHLDFLWAIDADKYVYKPLLENMERCWNEDCRNPALYN